MTRSRATLILAAILFAAIVAVLWVRRREPRERPLEPGWEAIVLTISAAHAQFSDPFGIAAAADGSIYLADAGDAQRIRRIAPDLSVTTIAGGDRGFADGAGSAARFNTPSGIALDVSGTMYVADTGNNAIRRVTPDGIVSTVAGDGIAGDRDGPSPLARFNGPIGVAVDPSGRVIVADTYNDRIRAITPDGMVSTIAGGPQSGALDAMGTDARFNTPAGVAVDTSGTIYVADTANSLVRAIPASGMVTTLASPFPDGFLRPTGIAVGPAHQIYVTDERGRVIEMSSDGSARTLAGSRPGFTDGAGAVAKFRRPAGIAVAGPGRLLVADAGNGLVRLVAPRARMELRPPSSPWIAPRFDVDAFGLMPLLWPIDPMDGPHEIAGTIGEARGGEGGERFHAGIDVHADDGQVVRAVRDGTIAAPVSAFDFGSLNESVRIGPLTYVHLRVGRRVTEKGRRRDRGGTGEGPGTAIDTTRFVASYADDGRINGIRVKRGARFFTGDVIGTVNRFNHVHLNVGWAGEERNPLLFRLVQFEDTVPPTIVRGGVRLFDENGEPIKQRLKGRILVHGRVYIIVDAWDQVDGNEARRRLGLYALGYQVLNADGSPLPGSDATRETIVFDRLANDPDAARLVYAEGSGIPFYGRRSTRFLYVVTNRFRDGVASPDLWDTTKLTPGNYTLRIIAKDIRGNEAIANRDVGVTVR